ELVKVEKARMAAGRFAVSPNGALLARAYGNVLGKGEAVVELFDADTAKVLHTLRGHAHGPSWLAFSPDSRLLYSADSQPPYKQDASPASIKVWDPATGKEVASVAGHGRGQGWALSPDGKHFAYAGLKEPPTGDKRVCYFHLCDARGKQLATVLTPHAN